MTAPTFAQLSGLVATRVGAWVALVNLSDAIATGLRSLGIYPQSPVAVLDLDLSTIQGDQISQLLDVAEWRALESALNNCDELQLRAAGIHEDPDKARAILQQRASRQADRIQRAWMVNLPTLAVDVVTLGFAADGNEIVRTDDDSLNYI